jgi:hypothetical protein
MSNTAALIIFLVILLGVPLGLILCTVVARDMDSRGLDGRIYGALTLLLLPVGVAVWVYKRSTTPRVDPPAT